MATMGADSKGNTEGLEKQEMQAMKLKYAYFSIFEC